jgi:hypothetical protein
VGDPHAAGDFGTNRFEKAAGHLRRCAFVFEGRWSNGRRYATVVGGRDARLTGDAMSRGWHLTPTGRVYELYSRLAWNGDVLAYSGGDKQIYWAVRSDDGRVIVTLINDSKEETKKRVAVAGRETTIIAPPRSILCVDSAGKEIERLLLPY